ncbi:MAG: ABC transporter ATP-binding protein [Xanthobacteraceae bacterium]|nr:ABC transporter ATP-binding protein [Xanthobacteraceae bacterium]
MTDPTSDSARIAAEPLLSLNAITKRFGSFTALSDVSLDLRPGEIHCILGENGAGKSTLCNLIFGVHRPDGGSMRYRGAPFQPSGPADSLAQGIAMVHQHFSLVGDMSVVDNVLLGRARGVLDRKACAAQLDRLAGEYGLPLDPLARIEDLSVGERQRVEIVKCLIRDPSLFVLDEPTAVLLPDEIAALLDVCRRVAASGRAVVLVTHKLAEIKQVADRVTVLRAGRVVATSDNPAAEIDALVRAMIQGSVEALDESTASMLGFEPVRHVDHGPAAVQPKAEVLQIDGLTVTDHQGVTRLDNFTLTVDRGEIVGVAGVEGNGQSELTAVLAGMMAPTQGRIYLGDQDLTGRSPREITAAGVGIVPEDRHAVGCVTGMSLAENIYLNRLDEFTRFGFLRRAALERDAAAMMQRFDVRARGPGAPFSSLSGGNQQKAVLAREITLPNLACLVAAQPTRGLDVGAVAAVYGHIRAACSRGVAILLVSSELDELLTVADRIVVLYRGQLMGACAADPSRREVIGAMMAGQPL